MARVQRPQGHALLSRVSILCVVTYLLRCNGKTVVNLRRLSGLEMNSTPTTKDYNPRLSITPVLGYCTEVIVLTACESCTSFRILNGHVAYVLTRMTHSPASNSRLGVSTSQCWRHKRNCLRRKLILRENRVLFR